MINASVPSGYAVGRGRRRKGGRFSVQQRFNIFYNQSAVNKAAVWIMALSLLSVFKAMNCDFVFILIPLATITTDQYLDDFARSAAEDMTINGAVLTVRTGFQMACQ